MPYYTSADHLIQVLKNLFERMRIEAPEATREVSNARLIIRLNLDSPRAEVTINGRHNPVRVTYGSVALRPDLDISLSADTLHQILLAELPLKKALASGQMSVRGPIFKTFALEDIFRKGQVLYPEILRQQTQNGQAPGSAG
jgi:hypothetical protein